MPARYGGSKNHHYIPQGILKNFCFEGASLHRYDRNAPEKGIERKNKGKVFQSFYTNSFVENSGRRNDYAEGWLDRNIDAPIASLVDRLIACNVAKGDFELDDEERRTIVRFICSSHLRKPEVIDSLVDLLNGFNVDEVISQRLNTDEKFRKQSGDMGALPSSFKDALAAKLAMSEHEGLNSLLLQGSLLFGVPQSEDDLLLIGDGLPIVVDHCEIWTVVAPSLAIGIRFSELVHELPDFVVHLKSTQVDLINRTIFSRSRLICSKCDTHLRSYLG